MYCLFFFFKQKTAYEMRISDWSSDVCSSDLDIAAVARKYTSKPTKQQNSEKGKNIGNTGHHPHRFEIDVARQRKVTRHPTEKAPIGYIPANCPQRKYPEARFLKYVHIGRFRFRCWLFVDHGLGVLLGNAEFLRQEGVACGTQNATKHH